MNINPKDLMTNLVRARSKGYSLPAEMYNSQEVYDIDVDVFFSKHWIVAGVEPDVAEPGDVMVLDIGKTSVLITRDDDNKLQAFHNVCRHRGARLVSEGKASVGKLVCPYHQWTYDLDGSLVYAASMGKSFDKSCHSLKPIQVRSLGGLIMICIAGEGPEDFQELSEVMEPRLAPFSLANSKIAFEKVIIEEGNWKLSIDNNRECYHCAANHPALGISIHPLDLTCEIEGMSPEELKEWDAHISSTRKLEAAWEAEGFPSGLVEKMSERETIFRTQRFAIAGVGESHTMDTRRASKRLLGELTNPKLGDLHFWTHNSWHHFFADHAVINYIMPLGPHRTELRAVWLVHKEAIEGVDYDIDHLTTVWLETNQEDADLVKITQDGVQSTGYTPGPLSESLERLVEVNMQWYLDRLKAHGY